LTDATIISKAGITAWNIPTGSNLTPAVVIDKSQVSPAVGRYNIAIRINPLKAVLGKDSSGNDAANIVMTVYDSGQSLPVTGEKTFIDFFMNKK